MAAGFSYFDRRVPSIAIHSLFDKYDTKRDGKLDEKEMKFFLEETMGMDLEQSQIYFFLLDKDGDLNVSYEEFKDWLRSGERFQRLDNHPKFERVCTAFEHFKTFDTDNSGTLDRQQFEAMMKYLGYRNQDMDEAFAMMDRHNNGKISFWEFMMWLNWAPIE
ncbi:caltractin-like [Stylophora pistillata]|nr:caltractin-like [Stylophora pistillata]